MIPLSTFPIFLTSAILLILAPGPDTLYIVARGVGQGRWAGVLSALGIFVGLMVQVAAATLGLTALLVSSKIVFQVVKWAGALYLIYLGVRLLTSPAPDSHLTELPKAHLRQIFLQGIVTNILNPKVALFFIAFLPQFVSQKMGRVPLQIFTLGMIFSVLGTLWNIMTGLTASAAGGWLRQNPAFARLQQRFTGLVFIGLGAGMANMPKG